MLAVAVGVDVADVGKPQQQPRRQHTDRRYVGGPLVATIRQHVHGGCSHYSGGLR